MIKLLMKILYALINIFKPTLVPTTPAPIIPLVVISIKGVGPMYQVEVQGTVPNNPLITASRVYFPDFNNQLIPLEQSVTPGGTFNAVFFVATSGPVNVQYSFVGSTGKESAKYSQTIDVPDQETPAAPTDPLTVVGVTFVP